MTPEDAVRRNARIDVKRFREPSQFKGDSKRDTKLCRELFNAATGYITSFKWCASVLETYVGYCVGGIVALVLFHIEPAQPNVDEWIWVIVGDLPYAYIAPASPDPRDALEDYIDQMSRWVEAVHSGRPVDDLIPVNVPPTRDWAEALASRLAFLRERLVPEIGG